MSKTISFTFNTKDIQRAIDEIKAYKEWLVNLEYRIRNSLAKEGLQVAQSLIDGFNIRFEIRNEDNVTLLVALSNEETRISYGRSGTISYYTDKYSPVLMAEFGSGRGAISGVSDNGKKAGTGTFGRQGHNKSWRYRPTPYGAFEESSGETPTRPLHNARMQMISVIDQVIRQELSR